MAAWIEGGRPISIGALRPSSSAASRAALTRYRVNEYPSKPAGQSCRHQKDAIDETAAQRESFSPYHLRLILNSFLEPHFLQASVRSSNSPLNSIGVIRMMTISVPQTGHVDEARASGGIS